MARFIWSLLVSVVVLFVAESLGWIQLPTATLPTLAANEFWNQALWLGILALIFTVVGHILWWIFALLFVVSGVAGALISDGAAGVAIGIGCLMIPVFYLVSGFIKLWIVGQVIPGFEYTHVLWQVFLLSAFVGISFNSPSSTSSSSSSSR